MTAEAGDDGRAPPVGGDGEAGAPGTGEPRAEQDASPAGLPLRRAPGRDRPTHDPWQPQGVLVEDERGAGPERGGGSSEGGGSGGGSGGGAIHRWLTVFLTGAECPYGCVFCDLWQHTLPGPTPPGAIPSQVAAALERPEVRAAGGPVLDGGSLYGIKLYNASNLFEPRAVPPADDAPLARAVAGFRRVVAECHPRLVGDRCLAFARRLAAQGSGLEVAMGLETIHPQALPRLGKAMDLDLFAAACERLLAAGCAVRAFVLVGTPYVPAAETLAWAARSAEWAFAHGVGHVSLIPVRGDTPEMRALRAAGQWAPPTLADLEDALDAALAAAPGGAVATADLWDLERLAVCDRCFEPRRRRLRALGLGDPAAAPPRPRCPCAARTEITRP